MNKIYILIALFVFFMGKTEDKLKPLFSILVTLIPYWKNAMEIESKSINFRKNINIIVDKIYYKKLINIFF